MSAGPTSPSFEIVAVPVGNGWRVRISDGVRMQFVSGFDGKAAAEEWITSSAPAWLAALQTAAERL